MANLRTARRAERSLDRSLSMPLSGIGSNETTGISIYDWARMFSPGAQVVYNGNAYQAFKTSGGAPGGDTYAANPVVFALASLRILLFSEARFQWKGARGQLFGNADLAVVETPWEGHTTRDLLSQAEMDVICSGNSYWVVEGGELQWLDPKNVKLITASVQEATLTGYQIGERLAGYAYFAKPNEPVIYPAAQVCHYKPYPDPHNRFVGMSWLSPCLPDVQIDETISVHKQSTIANGASLSYVVSIDAGVSPEQFESFVDKFRRQHEGADNASKTLFLGGGADVKTVGQTFENLALQATQGSGEVRVAACAGIPPAVVGFSEGLKGSTLNTGNYGEARRRLGDMTIKPLWEKFSGALESVLPVPAGSTLVADVSDVAFLREDETDQAAIFSEQAKSLQLLIQAGYEPDACVDAVMTRDVTRLTNRHTGLFSVQLLPPTDGTMPGPDVADNAPPALPVSTNGNGKQPLPA